MEGASRFLVRTSGGNNTKGAIVRHKHRGVTGGRQGQGGLVPPCVVVPPSEGNIDPQTREGLDQVLADRAELYICRPSEGLRVPLLVQPAAVNNDIP